MVRFLLVVALLAGLTAPAQAMFVSFSPDDTAIQLVSGGCGPYGHRDFRGFCRPNGPPPGFYRRCPFGFHPTPYGCRRNF